MACVINGTLTHRSSACLTHCKTEKFAMLLSILRLRSISSCSANAACNSNCGAYSHSKEGSAAIFV